MIPSRVDPDEDDEERKEEKFPVRRTTYKTIDFIVMVGFHHKVGSQVEFIYPPINEDTEGNLSAEFLK